MKPIYWRKRETPPPPPPTDEELLSDVMSKLVNSPHGYMYNGLKPGLEGPYLTIDKTIKLTAEEAAAIARAKERK